MRESVWAGWSGCWGRSSGKDMWFASNTHPIHPIPSNGQQVHPTLCSRSTYTQLVQDPLRETNGRPRRVHSFQQRFVHLGSAQLVLFVCCSTLVVLVEPPSTVRKTQSILQHDLERRLRASQQKEAELFALLEEAKEEIESGRETNRRLVDDEVRRVQAESITHQQDQDALVRLGFLFRSTVALGLIWRLLYVFFLTTNSKLLNKRSIDSEPNATISNRRTPNRPNSSPRSPIRPALHERRSRMRSPC